MKLFHHKRNRHLLATAFIMQLLFASCASDGCLDEFEQPETSFVIQIDAANFSQSPASRSNNTNSSYTTTFVSGDKAGLIAVDESGSIVPELNNVQLNFSSSKWSFIGETSLYYNPDYTYIAYYPYKEEATGLGSISELRQAFPPALDQSDISKYTTAEIMAAEGKWDRDSKTLRFGMKYLHTLLVLPKGYDTHYQFSGKTYSFQNPVTNVTVTVGGKVYKAMNWTNNNLKQYRVVIPASDQKRELRACLSGNDKSFILETQQTLAESRYYEWQNVGFNIGDYTKIGLRVGDFICRTEDGNDWLIVPQEAYEAATNPIGVVFHVGHNAEKDDDMSVYQNQFKDNKFHGYAVALTDVGTYLWAFKDEDRAYSQNAGTSTNTGDWKGYSNQKAIKKFADTNTDGWEFKHFGAAYRCSLYGTENGDDWQRRYAAPVNTSGWFLPSCDQLKTLYYLNRDNANLLATSMDNVKSLDQDHIRWFRIYIYYWSSTEYSQDRAWYVDFGSDSTRKYYKDAEDAVRAVLAF